MVRALNKKESETNSMFNFLRTRNFWYTIVTVTIVVLAIAIGCNKSKGGDIVQDDPVATDDTNPNATPNRIENGVRQNTVPVGVSSFALGVVEKFPIRDNQNIEGIGFNVVARSVKKVFTNELYTFPEKPDPQQVRDFIKFLIDNGHEVTHEIYILCGPCMRDSNDRVVNAMFPHDDKVSPNEFIQGLFSNHDVQVAVLSLFAEVVQHAKLIEELGADVLLCLELEDNHDNGESKNGQRTSYGILMDFARAAGWTNADGSLRRDRIVRNGGNSSNRIPGIRYERHGHSFDAFIYSGLRAGDVFNMDGRSFAFASDENQPDYLFSEEEVREMIKISEDRQILFSAWYAPLQGLVQSARYGYHPYPSLRDRAYLLNKPKELIAMLLQIPPEEVVISPRDGETY